MRSVAERGEIVVDNVVFYYPGSSEVVLSDISFHIKPGETVALVGENGAGKTTMVKLIARLYDPPHGQILYDGIDISMFPGTASDYYWSLSSDDSIANYAYSIDFENGNLATGNKTNYYYNYYIFL